MTILHYSRSIRDKALNIISGETGYQLKQLTPTSYKILKPNGQVYWVDWVGSDACECSCPATRQCAHMMAAGIHSYQTSDHQRREAANQLNKALEGSL